MASISESETFDNPPPSYEEVIADSERPSKLQINEKDVQDMNGKVLLKIISKEPHIDGINEKAFLRLTRDGVELGTITYHDMSPGARIDIVINGRKLVMDKHGIGKNFEFDFQSNNKPKGRGELWWKSVNAVHGTLEDAKKDGKVLAKVDEGLLEINKTDLSEEEWIEVVVTGVAIAELQRRKRGSKGILGFGLVEAVAAFLVFAF